MMKRKVTLPSGVAIVVELYDHREGYRKGVPFRGHYLAVTDVSIGLFVYEGQVYVFMDDLVDKAELFTITNATGGLVREFTLRYKGEQIMHRTYTAKTGYDINPFWPTDEEDVDDLLWISNVLNSTERIAVITETMDRK